MLRGMLRHTSAFRQWDSRGWLPLHRAASQPVLEVLQTVLTCFSWSSVASGDYRRPRGDVDVFVLVVSARRSGARPGGEDGRGGGDAADAGGESRAGVQPVKSGSCELTSMLVAHNAWLDQVCRRKRTAMHEAAAAGDVDVLMLLLRNGGRVTQRDESGRTPLALAAEHGHVDVAEILLNCGSSVNLQACNGESVLLDAAGSGSTACIQLLLANGADPNLPSASGHLPVHKAAHAGHYDALKMLLPLTTKKAIKEAGHSPVHSAAEGGRRRCLKLLLARGFNVNYRMDARNSESYRDMRRSALYFAVSNGDVDCTRMLLAAGARTDLDPLCCLLVGVRSGRHDIVGLLLAAGADVNRCFAVVSDTVFPTALQYCLKDEAMMRLLLNAGYEAERCFHCHHDDASPAPTEAVGGIPFCEFVSLCCVVHLSGAVVRTLLDYVGHVHICSKLRLLLEGRREWPEIRDVLNSPRPLGHLCRLEIRRRLTLKRLNNPEIMSSPVFPPRLRSFLLYQELDLCSRDPGRVVPP
ncbi:dynein axonemal heavy chain 12 isoform 3-T4 [Spinachia spinachia]